MILAITIALILIIVTLLFGLPVPFCFMLSTLFMVITQRYDPYFLLPYSFAQMSSLVLLAIPLFIMVGGLMDRGGIGNSLVSLIEVYSDRKSVV